MNDSVAAQTFLLPKRWITDDLMLQFRDQLDSAVAKYSLADSSPYTISNAIPEIPEFNFNMAAFRNSIEAGDIDALISPELLAIVSKGNDASDEDPKQWAKRLARDIKHFFD